MTPKVGEVVSSIRKALPEELGGKKDKDSVIKQLASFIDSIEKKPPPMQMAIGGSAGLVTGYIFTKGSKATALVLGIGLITFQDKTVLITGASSGLGAALARELYARGARLILVARSIDKLKDLCDSIKESGPGHEPVYAYLDLAEPEKVEELVKLSPSGKIDCLVNNAGISMRGSILETDMSVQRKVMETNYFGQVAVTRALLPFIPSDGAIVVTSSMQGKMALPYRSAYGASKHAVQAFFDSLRAEDRFGLHILVVSAGYIATELGNNALDASGRPTGVTDANVGNGLQPAEAARQIADATERRKPELLMAPLLHRFTVFLRYWWPSLYFYSVWKRHVMQATKKE